MKRFLTISTIAVLAVLYAAGTGMAQTRVLWGNDAGTNSGTLTIEGLQVMGTGSLLGTWDCPTSCDVDTIGVTLTHSGDGPTGVLFRAAVYDSAWNLMDTTAENTFTGNATTDWLIKLVNGFSATAGRPYYGCAWGNSSAAANLNVDYTTNIPAVTDTLRWRVATYTTNAWVSPLTPSASSASKKMKFWFIGYTVPEATGQVIIIGGD